MAAISLGVSAVEERLEELRSRLNWTHSMETIGGALAAALTAAAIAVGLGLQHHLSSRPGLIAVLAVVLCLFGAAAAQRIHSRWLSIADVAQLADRQGQLAERLTTLMALRQRKQSSRFAAILVAQSLALGPRWEIGRIAPWRLPRSTSALALALLFFAISNWLAPESPPPIPPQTPAQDTASPDEARVAALEEALAGAGSGKSGPQPSVGGDSTAMGGSEPSTDGSTETPRSDATAAAAGETNGTAIQSATGKTDDAGPQGLAAQVANWLPQQMARSLSGNFQRQQMGQAESLGTQPGETDEAGPRRGSGNKGDAEAKGAQANGARPDDAANHSTAANRSEPSKNAAKQGDGDGKDAAKGGEGSEAGSVLASANGAEAAANEPKMFKLTLSTFLQELDGRDAKQKPARAAARGGQRPEPSSAELSQRQQQDDAMRKAEIPAEFEELVRRVYSQRLQPLQEGE